MPLKLSRETVAEVKPASTASCSMCQSEGSINVIIASKEGSRWVVSE